MSSIPKKQPNHRYLENLDPAFSEWVDVHFGDHSFNGYVTIGMTNQNGEMRTLRSCLLTELKAYLSTMHISKRWNYYLTANTVTHFQRKKKHLFSLNNIVIDIDCHDETITPQDRTALIEAIIWRGKHDYWNDGTSPMPNSIVRTGRGVQFWWAIKPCAAATAWYYNQIKLGLMEFLTKLISESEELTGLKVDYTASVNAVGYFRLPGSYNTKAKKYSSLELLHKNSYNTHELFELLKPLMPSKSHPTLKTRTSKASNVCIDNSSIALGKNDLKFFQKYSYQCGMRIAKLIQLRSIRNRNIGSEARDLFCLFVYCDLRRKHDHEQAMVLLRIFNAGFKEPFEEEQLLKKLSVAQEKCYKFTNEKIIKELEITPEEQNQINFFPAKPRDWNNLQSNASRNEVRRIKREGRDAKIIELHQQGITQVEIGRTLEISRKTVGRIIKKWKEHLAAEEKEVGQNGVNIVIECLTAPNAEENTPESNTPTVTEENKEEIPPPCSTRTTVRFNCPPRDKNDFTKPIAHWSGLYVYKGGHSNDSS